MAKAVPRFKHRPVGPRKGNGAILLGTINPSGKKRHASTPSHNRPLAFRIDLLKESAS